MEELYILGVSSVNKHEEQYACIYIKDFCVQALLRHRASLLDQPCAVMDGESAVQYVCSLNEKARRLGANIGMTSVELDTFSGITRLRRSESKECSAKSILLQCAWSYSPRVEDISTNDACILVIDITGTEKLFGKPEKLIASLQAAIALLSFHCTIAATANYHASIFLARSLMGASTITVISSAAIPDSLAPIPIAILDLDPERTSLFHTWGIYTLGMLAELPELDLIARLGQEGKRLLQLANGTLQHHFRPVELELEFAEGVQLDSALTLLDSLLFVLGSLLDQIIFQTNQHLLAIRSLYLTLTLDNGTEYARIITPSLPSNNRALWLKLIHLDIDSHPPASAIVALNVRAIPGVPSQMQGGLFAPQSPEPARLDITLARIRSIVGDHSVGCPDLQDTNRPDAFRMKDFKALSPFQKPEAMPAPRLSRRQIRPPDIVHVAVADHMPHRFVFRLATYIVSRAYGPWERSGDWWNPSQWTIAQWDIEASSQAGARLYCSLTHENGTNHWRMTALYD
jgi:protein ImuB